MSLRRNTPLDPTDAEVKELLGGEPIPGIRSGVQATEPTHDEMRRFRTSSRRVASPSRVPLALGFAAVAASVVLVARLAGSNDPIALEGSIVALGAEPFELNAAITVEGRGAVEVVSNREDGATVRLTSGVATFDVNSSAAAHELRVDAGDVTVEVAGTRFSVEETADIATVRVVRGHVVVTHAGERVDLYDGQVWVEPEEIASAPIIPIAVHPQPVVEPVAPIVVAPKAVPPVEPIAVVDPVDPVDPAVDTPSMQERFSLIMNLDEGDGADEDILIMLKEFDRDYPGQLASSASEMRIRHSAATKPPRETIAAIDAWVLAYPNDPRAVRLLVLKGEIAREQLHDCSVALPAYRAVAERTRGEKRAIAQAYQGICARDQGNLDEAKTALDAALATLKDGELKGLAQEARDQIP